MDEIEKLKQDYNDVITMLFEHNRLLMSYKEQLDEFKTETRLNSHVINLRLDHIESRHDNHVHKGYQQGTTGKLYNNEQ